MGGWFVFDFPGAVEHIERGSWEAAAQTLLYSLGGIGAWIGAYVVLMVSVNMLPSAQDLKAGGWLFVGTVILLLILWILILTKGSPLGNAVAITHGVLIWLGLALTFILILTVPVFILLRLLTLG
jgi:hypothetical protein